MLTTNAYNAARDAIYNACAYFQLSVYGYIQQTIYQEQTTGGSVSTRTKTEKSVSAKINAYFGSTRFYWQAFRFRLGKKIGFTDYWFEKNPRVRLDQQGNLLNYPITLTVGQMDSETVAGGDDSAKMIKNEILNDVLQAISDNLLYAIATTTDAAGSPFLMGTVTTKIENGRLRASFRYSAPAAKANKTIGVLYLCNSNVYAAANVYYYEYVNIKLNSGGDGGPGIVYIDAAAVN